MASTRLFLRSEKRILLLGGDDGSGAVLLRSARRRLFVDALEEACRERGWELLFCPMARSAPTAVDFARLPRGDGAVLLAAGLFRTDTLDPALFAPLGCPLAVFDEGGAIGQSLAESAETASPVAFFSILLEEAGGLAARTLRQKGFTAALFINPFPGQFWAEARWAGFRDAFGTASPEPPPLQARLLAPEAAYPDSTSASGPLLSDSAIFDANSPLRDLEPEVRRRVTEDLWNIKHREDLSIVTQDLFQSALALSAEGGRSDPSLPAPGPAWVCANESTAQAAWLFLRKELGAGADRFTLLSFDDSAFLEEKKVMAITVPIPHLVEAMLGFLEAEGAGPAAPSGRKGAPGRAGGRSGAETRAAGDERATGGERTGGGERAARDGQKMGPGRAGGSGRAVPVRRVEVVPGLLERS